MVATEINNDLSFFAPITLTKGTDAKGQKVLRLGGIASTSREDADGEFLNPGGFDLDFFLKKGFMNWNHQTGKDPLAYVGKPTKGEITTKGLEIECELFANNPKALQVYQLGEVLEANGMALGFSIEGKVTKRNKENPKIVEKAIITGCAITPNPKNTDAVASIIKGHVEDFNLDSLGDIGNVDFSLLEGLEKSLSAYDDEDEETTEKAMSTSNANPLIKESLDKRVKKLTYGKDKKGKETLSKAGVYAKIYSDFPTIEGTVANRFYTLIEQIQETMSKKEISISQDAISKAYEVLGLTEGEQEKEVVKEQEETEIPDFSWDDIDEPEEEEEFVPTEEEIEAAKEILQKANLGFKLEEKDKEIEEEDNVVKSHEGDDSILDLIKGQFDELKKNSDTVSLATATLIKGLENQLGEMKATTDSLKAEIDLIGNQSQGRKSVTNARAIEKSFDNENDLNKGGELKVVSLSKNKKIILDTLEKGYLNSDNGAVINNSLANETMILESSNQLSKGIVDYLHKQGIQLVA